MRRGPKPLADDVKVLQGTFQPCREKKALFPEIPGAVVPPKWLKGVGLKLWHEKVRTYELRQQSIVGCESALAQYCCVEADLIDRYRKGSEVTPTLWNCHRAYANEFYDTPASQRASAPKSKKNKFSANGRPPEPAAE